MIAVIEHLAAFIGIVLLVVVAYTWVKVRQYQMSESQRLKEKEVQRTRRAGWHPDTDERTPRVS